MGLFGKIRDALKKTKDSVALKMRQLFLKDKIGEAFYDELEEILISADVSVRTAEDVIDQVREEAIGQKLKDQAFVTDLLKDILEDTLCEAPVPEQSRKLVRTSGQKRDHRGGGHLPRSRHRPA